MSGVVASLTEWPLLASVAVAMTAHGLRAGRRRETLNRALHEVRRPLQALSLAVGPDAPAPAVDCVRRTADALARLEAQVNGTPLAPVPVPVRCEPLLRAAVARWQRPAELAHCSLRLGATSEVVLAGDEAQLAQALDNLILNAIEHGGHEIEVSASERGGRVRLAVADSGRPGGGPARRDIAAGAVSGLLGRKRRGHGLAVVRQAAARHDGRFWLRRAGRGSVAVLELPTLAA